MKNKIYCNEYLKRHSVFNWFIIKYYGEELVNYLINLAKEEKAEELKNKLNRIWFELPDSRFNIQVAKEGNCPGWFEFLNFVED